MNKPRRCVWRFGSHYLSLACACRTSQCGKKVNGGLVLWLKKRTQRLAGAEKARLRLARESVPNELEFRALILGGFAVGMVGSWLR